MWQVVFFLANQRLRLTDSTLSRLIWNLAIAFVCCNVGVFSEVAQAQSTDTGPPVLTGIDVLRRDNFEALSGRKVGLITNHTGVNRDGVSTVKLLHDAPNVQLKTLFSPEHGFFGKLDQATVDDARDRDTGLKIISLYGKTRTPTAESLEGIDTLVFDIQDIGTRFYTYISTMGGAMRAAAGSDIRFVVLDRPNPIGGTAVQGPVLDEGSESFVGFHTIAVRHGMTTGEIAMMFREEFDLDLQLTIIQMEGWRRTMMFDETGLLWINPSPNMRSLTEALLYPGIGLLETTNLSVGRGTDTPFEVIGAPWIDPIELAAQLNAQELAGVRFVPIQFTPTASKYADQLCGGVNIIITDRASFHPLITGLTTAITLHRLYPNDWDTKSLNRLLANRKTKTGIIEGQTFQQLQTRYANRLRKFQQRRNKYLIYP